MAVNWSEIDRIAKAHRLVDPSASEETLFCQLRLWWCHHYNRPFKDPLISTYTLDELTYEYLCYYYLDPANSPILERTKTQSQKEDDNWLAEQMKKMQAKPKPEKPSEPIQTAPKSEEVTISPPDFPEISNNFD